MTSHHHQATLRSRCRFVGRSRILLEPCVGEVSIADHLVISMVKRVKWVKWVKGFHLTRSGKPITTQRHDHITTNSIHSIHSIHSIRIPHIHIQHMQRMQHNMQHICILIAILKPILNRIRQHIHQDHQHILHILTIKLQLM